VLLGAEASADPLGDLIAGERASLYANVAAAAGGERGEPALDCLLARTHASVVIRPPSRGRHGVRRSSP